MTASKDMQPNFTQIPNVLLDSCLIEKSTTFRVMVAICRKTYGFHKKKDKIAVSQLMDMTCLSNRCVISALSELEQLGLVILTKESGKTSTIEIDIAYARKSQVDDETGARKSQVPVHESHRQNKELNKEDTSISQPSVSEPKQEFDLGQYIGKMQADKNRLIRIIGHYLKVKDDEGDLSTKIASYEDINLVIKENLRHAKKLEHLSSDRILQLFDKAKEKSKNGREFDWKLSTLPKLMV